MKKSLAIFTRDLRLEDNYMLRDALDGADAVIPIFVFKDMQVNDSENAYFTEHGFQFLLESLEDLSEQFEKQDGTLFHVRAPYGDVLRQAKEEHSITHVYISRDVTPFAKEREQNLTNICASLGLELHIVDNHFLTIPGDVTTDSGSMYKVYTPFKNKANTKSVPEPITVDGFDVWQKTSSFQTSYRGLVDSPGIESEFTGGTSAAVKQLEHVSTLKDYKYDRDYMALDGTSKLSPHMKFGTISVRTFYYEVQKYFGTEHNLINELYWRDFYAHLADAFPHVFGDSFNEKYAGLEWEDSPADLQAWKDGMTGYPIVDAAMRQLNQTGWMHNRARMIVASFLTKHLLIDWREGEKYFAQKLVDYDPATNNGSWQWAASTGADAQPYFRIFNPWSQQEKFDKECEYIRKNLPEVSELSNKEIHKYFDQEEAPEGYVLPIVEHKFARERALERFKSI